MNSIANIYTETINKNFPYQFANWEPGKPVRLGDYGYLKNNVFIYMGNIEDIGISFEIRKDKGLDNRKFKSSGINIKKINIGASANINSVVNVKAKLEISFTKENSVFFNAINCTTDMIRSKPKLGKDILNEYKNGEWNIDYVVITDIMKSEATTIVISEEKNSSILFEAIGDVSQIDLADVNLGLNSIEENNISYQIATKSGLTPLIGLCQLEKSFWSGDTGFPQIEPISKSLSNDENLELMFNKGIKPTRIIDEKVEIDDLHFGQLK